MQKEIPDGVGRYWGIFNTRAYTSPAHSPFGHTAYFIFIGVYIVRNTKFDIRTLHAKHLFLPRIIPGCFVFKGGEDIGACMPSARQNPGGG